ncbi:MAG: LuxR C-terminal-related transcriptional regulator [Planctomycetota bacterium]
MSTFTSQSAGFTAAAHHDQDSISVNDTTSHVVVFSLNSQAGDTVSQLAAEAGAQTSSFSSVEAWQQAATSGNGSTLAASLSTEPSAATPSLVVLTGSPADWLDGDSLSQLQEALPGTAIAAALSSPSPHDVINFVRHGAIDVILLDDDDAHQKQAFAAALNKGNRIAKAVAEQKLYGERLEKLTPAEDQVLDEMLVGMANKQIAQALEIGLRTVELRRSKIMRKMQAKSLAELIKFVCIARGFGSVDRQAANA